MSSYIASATKNIRSIVEEIVISEKSDMRLALIEYRDHPPQVSHCTMKLEDNIRCRHFFKGSYICHTCS